MNNVESGGGYVYPECVLFAEEESEIGMLKPDCKSAVIAFNSYVKIFKHKKAVKR